MLTGAYTNNLFTEEQRFDVVRNACPGAGACGGMYTANTMASSIEALGMSLPYSSSIPAVDPLKRMECAQAGRYVFLLCWCCIFRPVLFQRVIKVCACVRIHSFPCPLLYPCSLTSFD